MQQILDTALARADEAVRRRFDAVCGGATLETAATDDVERADDVNRKDFLRVTLGVGAGAWVAHHFPGHDASELVASIAGPTAHYRRMEQTVPTDRLVLAVEAHRQLAAGIVADAVPTSAGYAVLAETTGLAAWLAADQGATGAARKHYATSVMQAERAGHPLLAAYMRASLGRYAADTGDPRHGLTLLRQARRTVGEQAPDAARAWLAALHATAHAALGDQVAAHTELRTAERLADRQRGEPSWPWVFTFDSAKAARYQAATLAALGDVDAARTAYDAAAPALAAPKARALAQVGHARALADAGHVAEGCALAADALTIARRYGSERITGRVREFRASLPHYTSDAADLDDELTALYAADEGMS